jgi:hypothetical protein
LPEFNTQATAVQAVVFVALTTNGEPEHCALLKKFWLSQIALENEKRRQNTNRDILKKKV